MADLSGRISGRSHLTTDGFIPYLEAVEGAFRAAVDYAQLVKIYGSDSGDVREGYVPSRVIGAVPGRVSGNPDPDLISTSYVERQNLTIRMRVRRLTRPTNAFSKKLCFLRHAMALHFAHYNLVRVDQTLRVTPAMEAEITDHVWTIQEIFGYS